MDFVLHTAGIQSENSDEHTRDRELLQSSGRRALLFNWRDIHNPQAGGAEVHIWEVFSRLVASGWDVEVLCARFPGSTQQEVIQGIRVHRIASEMLYHMALPCRYVSVANLFRPHIVIDFMNKLPLYSPLFVREPLCCFVHHMFGSSANGELGRLVGAMIRTYESPVRVAYRNTPILTGSASSIAELESLGLRRVEKVPLPYGVNVSLYSAGRKSETPTILYLGRLKRYKGIDHLIELMPSISRLVPGARLKIAGAGDFREDLECLAVRLGLKSTVEFEGTVSERRKVELYQEAWVTCLPSMKEGFGLTIPEAALCETPTVGYDVPGVCDAIRNGETGFLVPYGDRAKLEEVLCNLLVDEELRIRLGCAARDVYQGFTWENAAKAMESVLERQIMREDGKE